MKRVHIIISGYVQGVFFRANAQKTANSLCLGGWVKNLPEGEVELYAIGTEKNLKELITWCHQGPPHARVENVKITWDKDLGDFSSFEII